MCQRSSISLNQTNQGVIKGIRSSRNAPSTNRLVYVDDLLLLFKVDESTNNQAMSLLNKFADDLGLG